jgi:hypothetical protein
MNNNSVRDSETKLSEGCQKGGMCQYEQAWHPLGPDEGHWECKKCGAYGGDVILGLLETKPSEEPPAKEKTSKQKEKPKLPEHYLTGECKHPDFEVEMDPVYDNVFQCKRCGCYL